MVRSVLDVIFSIMLIILFRYQLRHTRSCLCYIRIHALYSLRMRCLHRSCYLPEPPQP